MHRFERTLTRLFARMLAGFQRSVPGENLMNLGFGATVGVIYASLFRGEVGQTVGGWFIAPVVLVFLAIFMISCLPRWGPDASRWATGPFPASSSRSSRSPSC